jgi:hypothetical protein
MKHLNPHPIRARSARNGWESQALGTNNGSKVFFNHWINVEIRIKYEIKNELHRDWWSDINPMVERCLGTIVGPKDLGLPPTPFGHHRFPQNVTVYVGKK